MQAVGLLDQLSPLDRSALVAKMARRSYRKANSLVHEGDLGDTLHLTDKRVVRRLRDVAALYDDGTGRSDGPLRQEDLTSMAGTTRPTTNRVLKQLEAGGMIVVRRGGVLIVDPTKLQARAR